MIMVQECICLPQGPASPNISLDLNFLQVPVLNTIRRRDHSPCCFLAMPLYLLMAFIHHHMVNLLQNSLDHWQNLLLAY